MMAMVLCCLHYMMRFDCSSVLRVDNRRERRLCHILNDLGAVRKIKYWRLLQRYVWHANKFFVWLLREWKIANRYRIGSYRWVSRMDMVRVPSMVMMMVNYMAICHMLNNSMLTIMHQRPANWWPLTIHYSSAVRMLIVIHDRSRRRGWSVYDYHFFLRFFLFLWRLLFLGLFTGWAGSFRGLRRFDILIGRVFLRICQLTRLGLLTLLLLFIIHLTEKLW